VPIFLGILSSLGIGVSDYFGRYGSRRSNSATTVLTALTAGVLVAAILTLVVPGDPSTRDLVLGSVSGLGLGFTLMLMYHGMTVSSTAVVSPLVAVFGAVVPLAWDVARGASLSGMAQIGIGIAVLGVAATTISPDIDGDVRQGIMLALAAGSLLGITLIFAGETSLDSGVWPAVSQRILAWASLAVYAVVIGVPRLLPRSLLRVGILSGVIGTGGMVAFLIGAQRGSLGEVAVASSMFPAVTAVLAAVFDDETLRWWHLAGIAGVLTGVGLIAGG
jgi:drug/metabolite transporter (DMT)-like permease